MMLSDLSVRRPVFAAVLSLLLIAFGLLSFDRLPLREYPDINPPIVSVETRYPGASAQVVETKITQLVEDAIAGIEGIRTISSASRDGRSQVTVEFEVERDIDAAANDVRDRWPAPWIGCRRRRTRRRSPRPTRIPSRSCGYPSQAIA